MNSNRTRSRDEKNWPQFLVASIVAVCMFTVGLHTGWPAPSVPELLSEEYPFDVTSDAASYVTVTGFVGSICGGFANVLMDKLGRKATVQLVALPQLLSFVLFMWSYEAMELMYIGRFAGGLAEGLAFNTASLYISEIASPDIRGLLGSLEIIAFYSGMLAVNIVGSYLTIRTTATVCLALPVVFSVAFWRMPESPHYLLMKNREEDARRSLSFLRRKDDVSGEVDSLREALDRQLTESGSLRDISNKMALLVTVGGRFFQTATGAQAFTLYIQVLLSRATDSLPSHIGASVVLATQVLVTVMTTFTIDKLGRKPLLLISSCGCFANLSLQTIYFFVRDRTSLDVSALDWFPLVMMVLHTVSYSAGFGVVTNQIVSEMFPANVKAKLTFFVNGFYAFLSLGSTKFYQATSDRFGLTFPFGTYAVLSLLGIFFIWFCVPETKGKSLEQIQQRLKKRTK